MLIHADVLCPQLPNPLNGRVRYEDSPSAFRPGGIVRYSCNTGYTVEGATMAECQVNGSWSAPVPTCLLG